MKQFQGIWFPDHEQHLPEWMAKHGELVDGRGTYQIKKLRKAVSYCTQRRVAIDVGANVGLWSIQLAKAFGHVIAYEPVDDHVRCYLKNMDGVQNYTLHTCSLGECAGEAFVRVTPGSCGDSFVAGEGNQAVRMVRLDDDYAGAFPVDFIKIDCEGYELPILRGARELINHCRPVICVEQKPGKAQKYGFGETEAVTYLEDLGYKCVAVMSGDYIMVPA